MSLLIGCPQPLTTFVPLLHNRLASAQAETIGDDHPTRVGGGNARPKENRLLTLLYEMVLGLPTMADIRVFHVWFQRAEEPLIPQEPLKEELNTKAYHGDELDLDESIENWVWTHRRPLIIAAEAETDFPDFARRLLELNVKFFCAVPFTVQDRRIAILGLAGTGPNAFGNIELAFVPHETTRATSTIESDPAMPELPQFAERSVIKVPFPPNNAHSQENFEEIVGGSSAMRELADQVKVVAPTGSNVLILGETGSGKERLAQAIHNQSSRRDGPFIKVNCAAIPAGLIESELFGHERGAFTGAIGRRAGRFEMAQGGTLFLDEIGDVSPELQPKLLRVLQERQIERVGGTRTIAVDVRIVAATSRDLSRMVAAREFRADLYYRLNVFPLRVPPLRERPADIPLLVRHLLEVYCSRAKKEVLEVSKETREAFLRHPWQGNVRELQNVVERSVITSPGKYLQVDFEVPQAFSGVSTSGHADKGNEPQLLVDVQREHIIQALESTNWVVGGPKGAAARVGMARSSLISKMRKLGIVRARA
ncbi:MAG: sigma 54-interacting transcriptional regulator [Verrucomicrobiota bacterium]